MRNRGGYRERYWEGKNRGRGNGKGIYTVPFPLRFGHFDLAGIRLTALVYNIAVTLEIP